MLFISYLPHMKAALFITIFFGVYVLQAQSLGDLKLPEPKRFIDKIEIFAGPNLSFNYGNKFVDNYYDGVIKNTRLTKIGYWVGLGLYHPITARIDVNAKVQWEQKGAKAELNRPLGNDRQTITSEYTYNYTSISISPRYLLGKKKVAISFGGYVAMISSVRGQEIYSDPSGGPSVNNNFEGRYWSIIDPDGAIRNWTFIPGLKSFNKYDYGLILGVSYGVSLKKRHNLLFYLVDRYGLQNVYNDKFSENLLEKNHTVSISLGYVLQCPNKKSKIKLL